MFENAKSIKYNKNFEGKKNAVNVIFNADTNGFERVLSIPMDEANKDYQDILQWVADGNTIQEAD